MKGAEGVASALLDSILSDGAGDVHAQIAKGGEEDQAIDGFVECLQEVEGEQNEPARRGIIQQILVVHLCPVGQKSLLDAIDLVEGATTDSLAVLGLTDD